MSPAVSPHANTQTFTYVGCGLCNKLQCKLSHWKTPIVEKWLTSILFIHSLEFLEIISLRWGTPPTRCTRSIPCWVLSRTESSIVRFRRSWCGWPLHQRPVVSRDVGYMKKYLVTIWFTIINRQHRNIYWIYSWEYMHKYLLGFCQISIGHI